jgi:PAS domain-containing protein
VLDFAVAQIMRDDTALGALPAVLARLVEAFGLRAALACQPAATAAGQAAKAPAVLAMHPPDAVDETLLARIGALASPRRDTVTAAPEPSKAGSPGVLLARSVPVAGQCLCALALIASAIPGVLITDEQGTVTNASESFGQMFGLAEPSRRAGTPAVEIMRRIGPVLADPARFARRITAVVRARQPLTGEQIQAADGRTIEGGYWPVLVGGVHRGDIWLAWDMTDRLGGGLQGTDRAR